MSVRRIPTREDYEAFDGAHCNNLWRELTDKWRCPGCDRTKFEVMRWALRTPSGRRFWGWIAAFHRHHDHLADYEPGFWLEGEWIHDPIMRFDVTVVCDQCNSIDGIVKRKLGLRQSWSYSPAQIRRFVTATPHGKHVVDYAEAQRIYDEADVFAWTTPNANQKGPRP